MTNKTKGAAKALGSYWRGLSEKMNNDKGKSAKAAQMEEQPHTSTIQDKTYPVHSITNDIFFDYDKFRNVYNLQNRGLKGKRSDYAKIKRQDKRWKYRGRRK